MSKAWTCEIAARRTFIRRWDKLGRQTRESAEKRGSRVLGRHMCQCLAWVLDVKLHNATLRTELTQNTGGVIIQHVFRPYLRKKGSELVWATPRARDQIHRLGRSRVASSCQHRMVYGLWEPPAGEPSSFLLPLVIRTFSPT